MGWETVCDAHVFIRNYGNEVISIGGGEPTLHPRFFDILKRCLEDFDYVWLATNGSRTKKMWRLSNIIDGEDYPKNDYDDKYIYQDNKLTVALSQDYFHDPIDEKIIARWKRKSENRQGGYEVRDVTKSPDGVIAQGRAKKTGSGWGERCPCADIMILPTGEIKICGCSDSPIIGNVRSGFDSDWEEIIQSEKFTDSSCYTTYKKKEEKRKYEKR